MFSRLKRSHILILSVVVFIVTLVLILLELDRQNYQVKKKEIIVNYWDEFFPLDQEELTLRSRLVLQAATYEEREKAKTVLTKSIRRILESDTSIYKIALEDSSYQILLKEEENKFRKYNRFSNSLFLKGFRGQTSLKISDPMKNKSVGRVIVAYTTPLGDTRINDLTTRYRFYALFLAVFLSLVYAYILKYLILPVKRI